MKSNKIIGKLITPAFVMILFVTQSAFVYLRTRAFEERKQTNLLTLSTFLPSEAIAAIRDSHGGSVDLLPLQQRVVEAGILDPSREEFTHNVILEGPTSAGKTDPAFWKALILYYKAKAEAEKNGAPLQGRYRTVFFEPSKALCAERARAFALVCEQLNIRVRFSNSDYTADDQAITFGEFDILICTNEKFAYFMQANKNMLDGVGMTIVDELEVVNEDRRGAYLETVMKLVEHHRQIAAPARGLTPGPVLVCLAVPLKGLQSYARKLNADVVSVSERPISIQMGIWRPDTQLFEPFDSNTGALITPRKMELGDPKDKKEFLKKLVLQCKGYRLMLAVPTRGMVKECCELLTELCHENEEVREAITTFLDPAAVHSELAGLEGTSNRELLTQSLPFGIGAHDASMRDGERSTVEKLFRNGDISLVVSTATLEKGINVSADAVVFYGWGEKFDEGRKVFTYIDDWLEMKIVNWVGRAGRVGQTGVAPGPPFAMYVAGSNVEAGMLDQECERINSALIGERGAELHTQLAEGYLERNILLAATALEPFTVDEMTDFFTSIPLADDLHTRFSLARRVPMELVYLANPSQGAPFLAVRRIVYGNLKGASRQYPERLPRRVQMDKMDTERLLFSMARLYRMEGFSNNAKRLIAMLGTEIRKAVRRTAPSVLRKTNPNINAEQISAICTQEVDRIVSAKTEASGERARFVRLAEMEHVSLDARAVIRMHNLLEALGRPAATEYFLKAVPSATGAQPRPTYLRMAAVGAGQEKSRFELTAYGRICSSFGVTTSTVDTFYSWLMTQDTERLQSAYHALDIVNLLMHTEDGFYMERLGTGIIDLGEGRDLIEARSLFLETRGAGPEFTTRVRDNVQMLVKLGTMARWMDGAPFHVEGDERAGIEDLFMLRSGSLDKVSGDFARLCRAFSRTCRALSNGYRDTASVLRQTKLGERIEALDAFRGRLEELADRLEYGLPQEAIPIAKLGAPALTRGWVTKLITALPPTNTDLPILERLNAFDVQGLTDMGIPRGIAESLKESLDKNESSPLAENLRARPWLIPALLLLPEVKESQIEQGRSRIPEGKRFTALRVIKRDGTHVVWRRNDYKTRQPIELKGDNYDEFVRRGACEFLAETGEIVSPGKSVTDCYFIDFDPRNGYSPEALKMLVWRAARYLYTMPEVARMQVTCTGGSGYHLEAYFNKGVLPKDIDTIRTGLAAKLAQAIGNPKDVFLKQDPTNVDPYVFVDLSPNMMRGVYRNLYSLHPTKGGVKVIMFELDKAKPADHNAIFQAFKKFDTVNETKPEIIITKFLIRMGPAQEEKYIADLAQTMRTSIATARQMVAELKAALPAPIQPLDALRIQLNYYANNCREI